MLYLGGGCHILSNRLAPFPYSTLSSPTLRLNTLALVRGGFKNKFHGICPLEEGTTPPLQWQFSEEIFTKKLAEKVKGKGRYPFCLIDH